MWSELGNRVKPKKFFLSKFFLQYLKFKFLPGKILPGGNFKV